MDEVNFLVAEGVRRLQQSEELGLVLRGEWDLQLV
jgi:hypothetical protein